MGEWCGKGHKAGSRHYTRVDGADLLALLSVIMATHFVHQESIQHRTSASNM